MSRLTARYGASPLHLLGHLAAFAITYYALSELLLSRYAHPINWVAWFVGGALLHDLVFLPLYVILDGIARRVTAGSGTRAVPVVNHIRVPVVMAATMFLVYFPNILGRGTRSYEADTGHAPPDWLAHWLLICALLFAGSAVAYAVRLRARPARHGA